MTQVGQYLAFLTLVAWVGAWWLAVRAIFGNLGAWEWLPVSAAAFAVPMLLADSTVQQRWVFPWLLGVWAGVALIVDSLWLYKRIRFGRPTKPMRRRSLFERGWNSSH